MSEFARVQMMAGISQDELDELKKRIMDMAVVKWSEMTPEERDKLVHEKVMELPLSMPCTGAIAWKRDPFNNRERGHWICECGYYGVTDDTLHFGLSSIPVYSASMDAAWLVVRRMNETVKSDLPEQDALYPKFIASLRELIGSNFLYAALWCSENGDALTPRRICLAALKAVGIEVEP